MAEDKKYLVEFIAQWIRDPAMRRRILYEEQTKLDKEWPEHSVILRSFNRKLIIKSLLEELEKDLKIDLRRLEHEVHNSHDGDGPYCEPGPDGIPREEIFYEETDPHVRGVEPPEIVAGQLSLVRVRGHGWDEKLEISFRPEGGNPNGRDDVPGEIISFSSDIDIYQHAVVQVTLGADNWTVHATVRSKGERHERSQEPIPLRVR